MARNHRIVAVGSENLHLMVDSASNHPSPLRISPRPRWGLLDGNATMVAANAIGQVQIYRTIRVEKNRLAIALIATG